MNPSGSVYRRCLFGGALFAAGLASQASAQNFAFERGYALIDANRITPGTDPHISRDAHPPFGFGTVSYSDADLSGSFRGNTTSLSFTHNRGTSNIFSYSAAGFVAYVYALQNTPVEMSWDFGNWTTGNAYLADFTLAPMVLIDNGGAATGHASATLLEGHLYAVSMVTLGSAPGGNSWGTFEVAAFCIADINRDGVLNLDDIAMFADAFLGGCP